MNIKEMMLLAKKSKIGIINIFVAKTFIPCLYY